MPTSDQHQSVHFGERVAYAMGDLASCLYYNTFVLFLMFFYTDTFGIGAAAAGTMIMVTRIIDTVADPVVGIVADRTKTRFGKFRPWLLWMAFPFFVSGVLLFYTPNVGQAAKLLYAYVTYTLVMLVYSAINIPYGALMGVMTPDSYERTKLASYRFVGAFTGNLIVQATFVYLLKGLGHGNDKLGYPLAFGVFGITAMCLFLIVFASTRERVHGGGADVHLSVQGDVGNLLKNRPWLVLGAASILFLTWVSIRGASFAYYFKYYVVQYTDIAFSIGGHHFAHHFGPAALLTSFFVSGTVCSVIGVTLTPILTKIFGGKKRTYMWLSVVNAATLVPMFFAGPNNLTVIFGSNIIGSLFTSALNPLIWAMYADTADYAEWKFGSRTTGLIFSAGTFAQKMGWAIGGGVAGLLLSSFGYHANVAQNTGTLFGIRLSVSLLPAVVSILTMLVIGLYNLDAKFMEKISAELKVRRAAAPAATTI